MGRFVFGAFAAFNILAAIVFIGCGACANYFDARSPWHVEINKKRVADEEMLQAHLREKVPGYPAVKIVGIVLGYLASAGLILAGIALFFGRWWGKLVAAPIFALAFLHHVAFIIYQLVWINPAIDAFFTQIPRPAIIGDAADIMIKAQSYGTRVPGYISIAWWVVGCLYYLVATPVVLFTPTSSGDAGADKPTQKSRRPKDADEDDENDDENDEDEEPRPKRKRPPR